MADAVAKFHLSLSEDMAGAAAAAGHLDAMKIAIQADIKELNALKLAMNDMRKGGQSGTEAFDAMKAGAASLQKRIADNQAQFVKLGGSFAPIAKGADAIKKVADASKDSKLNIEEMTAMAKGALGPMGGLYERATLLTKGMGGGGLAGVVILSVVAFIALTSAVAVAVFKMAEFALISSDAAMKQRAMIEGIAGSAKEADGLAASINAVAAKVPLASSEVQKLAADLYKAGKRGSELEEALMSASLVASGLGKNASPDLLRRRMLNLDVQSLKFKEHIATIFSGVKIEGFLSAMKEVLSVFDSSTASGHALKAIVEVMLNPLFDHTTTIGPVVKDIFRGMVIGALRATVVFLTVRNAIRDMIPPEAREAVSSLLDAMGPMFSAVQVGIALFAALAAPIIHGFTFLIMGAAQAYAILVVLAGAISAIVSAATPAAEWLANLGASAIDAAGSIISGLVNGITSGAGAVVAAMTALASNAMNAFKSAIGYGSPAKAFIAYGQIGIAGGVEKGVDDGAPSVNAAVDNMVSIPSAAPGAAKMGGGGGAKVVVQLLYGGQDKAEERRTRSLMAQMCEAIEDGCKGAGIALELEPV